MNIGVFGGTFDPIHLGHLIVAEEIRIKLKLDEVLFVSAGLPWLKTGRALSPARHRAEMIRLAIASNKYFKLSTIEIDRPGPSYSVDTMENLRNQFGSGVGLYFILGSDALAELPRWKEPSRLIQRCYLVFFTRPGYPIPELTSLEPSIPGISSRSIQVEVPQIDISSTQIRNRVSQGLSLRYLVPQDVEKYIIEQKLYLP